MERDGTLRRPGYLGIKRYHYLEGSTPEVQRRAAITAFKADDLLEGTEEGGQLSYEELLALVG